MLVPAGILILVVLAAIAVDSAIAFGAQRELINSASAAANDAVTKSLTEDELQRGRDARPDPTIVERNVVQALVGREIAGYRVQRGDVSVAINDDVVDVQVRARIPYVFAPAVPGMKNQAEVTASTSARLQFD